MYSSSTFGSQLDCHQPLNVSRLPLCCGLTVVTKCAERVVTVIAVLDDEGNECTEASSSLPSPGGGVDADTVTVRVAAGSLFRGALI